MAAVVFSGLVAVNSTDTPNGWGAWEVLGPAPCFPQPCADTAFYAKTDTQPVFGRDGSRLYLFVRGNDNNLYMIEKNGSNAWSSTWTQVTSDSKVLGRISIVLTRPSGGDLTVHTLFPVGAGEVEYRAFDESLNSASLTRKWTNALEGTLGTDGDYQVCVAILNGDRLKIETLNYPWNGTWQSIASRPTDGAQGQYFDISTVAYLGGFYHVAFAMKYYDDIDSLYRHTLAHAQFYPGQPDDGNVRTIYGYSPSGSNHPLSELANYRNKLLMAYKDEAGIVRHTRLDSSDPTAPWIGTASITGTLRKTAHRPALGLLNRRPLTPDAAYDLDNFGNELFAAISEDLNDEVWFLNLSRTASTKYFDPQIAIWDDVHEVEQANCSVLHAQSPTLVADAYADGRPLLTELGFITWAIPDWLSNHTYADAAEIGCLAGNNTNRFPAPCATTKYPFIIKNGGGLAICSGIWINRDSDYMSIWDELGHTIATGPLGFNDDPNSPPTQANADLIGLPLSTLLAGETLFRTGVNEAKSCSLGTAPGGRCRGFTGKFSNYDVGSLQHAWLYVVYTYIKEGEQLRQWIRDDSVAGLSLLGDKYEWIKTNIFRGVEFWNDNEPISIPNDNCAQASQIQAGTYTGTTEGATTDGPVTCGYLNISPDVWFKYTADFTGTFTVDSCGSSFDTVLSVYSGLDCVTATLLDCNDDAGVACANPKNSLVTVAGIEGTDYLIRLRGYGDERGDFVLNLVPNRPANDNFGSAATVAGASGTLGAHNQAASKEPDEPIHAGNVGGQSVWWKWDVPVAGNATIETTGSNFDTTLSIYTGGYLGGLTLVAADDDSGAGTQSKVTFTTVSGATYMVAVDGYNTAHGNISLTWSLDVSLDPTSVDFDYTGAEFGTVALPFNTLAEAVAQVPAGGTINIAVSGTENSSESVPLTLGSGNKAMVIRVVGSGSAKIGGPAP